MSDINASEIAKMVSLNAALAKVFRKEGQPVAGDDGIMSEIRSLTPADREWFKARFLAEYGATLA